VFENKVLRRMFGPKRDEVAGEWRRLHNEPFMICTAHQYSGDQIKKNKMGGACDTYRGEAYRVLMGRSEGQKSLGRPRHRWDGNIKRIFKKWGGGIHWIFLAQDWNGWQAVGKAIMELWVPYS
jgi:hypothetical protein